MASLNSKDFQKDRELMLEALANKNVCPYCASTSKRLRVCGACGSVKYCSKSCQSADWPEHKNICKTFQHVVEVMKTIPSKTLNKFLRAFGCAEVFYVLLTVAEIEADLVLCMVQKPTSEHPSVLEVVIANGRVYDLTTQAPPNEEFPPKEKRKLQPVPSFAQISADPFLNLLLATRKTQEIGAEMIPRLLNPSDFDATDFELVKKFECMLYMQKQWLICEEGLIVMRLFGHAQVEKATRVRLMDFVERMDNICSKTTSFEKRFEKVEKLSHKLWKKLNLKDATRQKINYPWRPI